MENDRLTQYQLLMWPYYETNRKLHCISKYFAINLEFGKVEVPGHNVVIPYVHNKSIISYCMSRPRAANYYRHLYFSSATKNFFVILFIYGADERSVMSYMFYVNKSLS